MKNRESFKFYRTFFESVSELSNKQRLDFYEAIFNYSFNYVEPSCKGVPLVMFNLMKPILKKSNDGFISAYPSKDPSKDPAYKEKDKDKDKDKVNDNSKEKVAYPNGQQESPLIYFRSYMDVKEWLEINHSNGDGTNKVFSFKERVVKISTKGIPYYQDSQNDMEFKDRKVFYRYLFDNQQLLKG